MNHHRRRALLNRSAEQTLLYTCPNEKFLADLSQLKPPKLCRSRSSKTLKIMNSSNQAWLQKFPKRMHFLNMSQQQLIKPKKSEVSPRPKRIERLTVLQKNLQQIVNKQNFLIKKRPRGCSTSRNYFFG